MHIVQNSWTKWRQPERPAVRVSVPLPAQKEKAYPQAAQKREGLLCVRIRFFSDCQGCDSSLLHAGQKDGEAQLRFRGSAPADMLMRQTQVAASAVLKGLI